MKTVKQIADEIGITKQAVFMKIKRNEEFAAALNEHMIDDGGVNVVDETGENIIKSTMKRRSNDVNMNVGGNVDKVVSAIVNAINGVNGSANTDDMNVGGNVDSIVNAVANAVNGVDSNIEGLKDKLADAKIEIARLTERNIAQEQMLAEKEKQIDELRRLLGEQTKERQAYSVALLTANTKLSEIRHLTLTDRVFGWGNVQSMMTDSTVSGSSGAVDIEIVEGE